LFLRRQPANNKANEHDNANSFFRLIPPSQQLRLREQCGPVSK
jgi:hypothetical protein